MPPYEPPTLQPEQPVNPKVPTPIARRKKKLLQIALISLVAVVSAAFVGWSFYFSPNAVVADALGRLSQQQNTQLKGVLDVVTSEGSQSTPARINFVAEKQPNTLYMNGELSLALSGKQVSLPAEILVDGQQNSYLKLRDTRLSDVLVRNSNPDSALKLLNADAVFNIVIKDQWLQLSSGERAEIYGQPFTQSTFNILPAQSCLAVLLDGDSRANAQLIESFSEIIAIQGVKTAGEDNIQGSPHTHYKVEIAAGELESEWNKLLASSNVKAFNECARRQPGLTVPNVSVDMWIDRQRRLGRLQLGFDMQPQKTSLSMDIAYNQKTNKKTIPTSALTLRDLKLQIKKNQAAIDKTFASRLASFPALNNLVIELRRVEDLRQGLSNSI